MKNVQIPEDLFFSLCHFHLLANQLNADDEEELAQEIQDGLKSKLEAMQRRRLYTMYKDTKASPADREAARQAYLDAVGMFPDWRWDTLEPPQ